MEAAAAPAILAALEQSAFGAAIRQSVWMYPAANVGHIVALTLFVPAVAILDLRLLGAFSATEPGDVIRRARAFAMFGFALMVLTGAVLFTAEATHVWRNPVFRFKMVLIALALLNGLTLGAKAARAAELAAPGVRLPGFARVSAALSLVLWIAIAASGRLIAYL